VCDGVDDDDDAARFKNSKKRIVLFLNIDEAASQ